MAEVLSVPAREPPPQIRTCATLFLTSATITNKPQMPECRVAQERGLQPLRPVRKVRHVARL